MKRKRIKKYNTGGSTLPTNFQAGAGFSGTAAGQGLGMFGGMAGQAIQQADMADGHMSTGGAIGSGALKGVSAGAAFGPLGMLIGGGIGIIGGLINKKKVNDEFAEAERLKREQEREQARLEREAELQAMDAALEQYPVTGNATPRFSMGGDTNPPNISGGEQYFAIPNYGGSMDPNASPSIDFYYGGQKMPAQEFIQHLPEGVNINDVAQYGYAKSKPRYSPTDGWSYSGQNEYMSDFQGMMNTPSYAYGGSTDPKKLATERATSLHPKAGSMVDQYPEFANALGSMPQAEFDAFRDRTLALKEQAAALKGQGTGAALDFARNVDISYLKPLREKAGWSKGQVLDEVLGKTDLGYIGRKGAKAAMMMKEFGLGGVSSFFEKRNEKVKEKVPPFMLAMMGVPKVPEKAALGSILAHGGATGPNYEVEGGEMMQYQPGDQPATYGQGGLSQVSSQEFEVKGPKHSQGGVKASDNKGARVYSDQLKVDPTLAAKLMKL